MLFYLAIQMLKKKVIFSVVGVMKLLFVFVGRVDCTQAYLSLVIIISHLTWASGF